MAAFTTIAAATIAVGGQAAKGFMAADASKDAARQAGRLNIEKEELEKEAVARLEANYYDAVRATTDVYDKQLQTANVMGSQIVEAAQEGDQRGVSATAGKVKLVGDATTGKIADKYAEQKMTIDMKRAEASETDAAKIALMFDDRAQAAGVKADALTKQADDLSGQATSAFISAGTSALSAGVTAFGGFAGGEKAMGKAADAMSKSSGIDRAEALQQIQAGNFSNSELSAIRKSGSIPSATPTKENVLGTGATPTTPTQSSLTGAAAPTSIPGFGNVDLNQLSAFVEQQNAQQAEAQAAKDYAAMNGLEKAMFDIQKGTMSLFPGGQNPLGNLGDIFKF